MQGLAILAIGVLVGIWRSFSLLDPFFLVVFLCCSVILVGPIVVAGYARYSDPFQLLRDAVLEACACTLLALVVAFAWLNYQWKGDVLLPDGAVFFSALLLSFALATLGGIMILLPRQRLRDQAATWAYRAGALLVVLGYIFFPQSWSYAISEFCMEHGIAQVVLGVSVAVTAIDAALLPKVSQEIA